MNSAFGQEEGERSTKIIEEIQCEPGLWAIMILPPALCAIMALMRVSVSLLGWQLERGEKVSTLLCRSVSAGGINHREEMVCRRSE